MFTDERFVTNAWRVANREALDAEIEPIFAALDREEAIRRLNASQIAWDKLTEIRELGAHAALRRMPVRLPNGSEVLVRRPFAAKRGTAVGPGDGLAHEPHPHGIHKLTLRKDEP